MPRLLFFTVIFMVVWYACRALRHPFRWFGPQARRKAVKPQEKAENGTLVRDPRTGEYRVEREGA